MRLLRTCLLLGSGVAMLSGCGSGNIKSGAVSGTRADDAVGVYGVGQPLMASMTQNREPGLFLTDATSVQTLYTTIMNDYAGAPAF